MNRRLKQAIVAVAIAAPLVGGGAAVAFAQTSPTTPAPATTPPATTPAPAPHGSANCPNM